MEVPEAISSSGVDRQWAACVALVDCREVEGFALGRMRPNKVHNEIEWLG